MELPSLINVKKEVQSSEYGDTNENFLNMHFDVQIKISTRSCIKFENDDCYYNFWEKGRESCTDLFSHDELMKQYKQKCSQCHRIFENRYTLLQHNLTHLKINLTLCDRYRCEDCSAYFQNKKELNMHNNRKHRKLKCKMTETHRRCQICDKILTYKSWFSHVNEVHKTEEIHCDFCDKVFKCERYLRRHMSKHEDIKTEGVTCDQCPAVLKHKEALKTHKRNCHSNVLHACNICNARFKSNPYLVTHLKRVHYNDGKDYWCECGKKYSSPRRLRIHKKNAHFIRHSSTN